MELKLGLQEKTLFSEKSQDFKELRKDDEKQSPFRMINRTTTNRRVRIDLHDPERKSNAISERAPRSRSLYGRSD